MRKLNSFRAFTHALVCWDMTFRLEQLGRIVGVLAKHRVFNVD